jgi:alkylation response protein AidB-like acyl-CoA dehydrogenase
MTVSLHGAPDAESLAVRDVAREVAQRVLAPQAAELDRLGGFPTASLAEIARHGLLAVNIPRELGGLAAGAVAYSLAVTELARACAATTVAVCVSNMVAEVVVAFGNTEQRAHWVPRLARGELKVGAFALSEPGAGSDPGGMTTRARRSERGWVLEGEKLWITSGSDAGLFVVWARTSDAPGPRGLSCFLVPGDAPGLSRGRPEHKLGLRGSTTTALRFDACEVGDEARLGEEGRGFPVAMMALDGGRIGIASQALGIGQAALAAAVEHARQQGASASEDQGRMWPLVDSATDLEAAALLTLRAAGLKRAGRPFSREASMAKLWASEKANVACLRAIEALGAAGIDRDHGVERTLRDVRVTTIYEGTSEIQRIVIGREIMRRFGEAG